MNDKLFDLIENMHIDLTQQIRDLAQQIRDLSKEQQRQGTVLENDIRGEIKALFDGYKQTYEGVKEIKEEIGNISLKLEKQEVEIKVIKGGK
jgi:hypothetical protein